MSGYVVSAPRRLTGSSRFQISESGELNNSLSALFQQVFISGWWRAPLSPPTPPLIHPVKWYHAGYSWSSCPSFAALPTPPHRDRQAACAKPIPPPPLRGAALRTRPCRGDDAQLPDRRLVSSAPQSRKGLMRRRRMRRPRCLPQAPRCWHLAVSEPGGWWWWTRGEPTADNDVMVPVVARL